MLHDIYNYDYDEYFTIYTVDGCHAPIEVKNSILVYKFVTFYNCINIVSN